MALDAHIAEFGHARQRLTVPAAVAMIQHVNAAPHVVELGDEYDDGAWP